METAGSNSSGNSSSNSEHDKLFVWLGASLALLALVFFILSHVIPLAGARYQGAAVQQLYSVLLLVWPVFFLLQASLAALGYSRQHRSFGMVGISLATAVEFSGCAALIAVLENARAQGLHANDLAGVAGGSGFAGLLLFMVFFAWAVVRRRRIAVHKRMMLLATLALMQQPASGLTFIPLIPPHLLLSAVVLAIVCLRDWHVRKHVHTVYVAGGGVLLAVQGLQYVWAGSALWQTIVDAVLVFGQ